MSSLSLKTFETQISHFDASKVVHYRLLQIMGKMSRQASLYCGSFVISYLPRKRGNLMISAVREIAGGNGEEA